MFLTSINDAVDVIDNVGFPIFCVIALGALVWLGFKHITQNNSDREAKLYELLGETRKELDEAININAQFVNVLNDLKNDISDLQNDIAKIQNTLALKRGVKKDE